MYYDPEVATSGLPHSPFAACCVPRPIGWMSTVSKDGVHNLAPFSQFQNVTFDPPTVLFAVAGIPMKDTARNVLDTGEWVWNMATYDQRNEVARSALVYPPDVDEFAELGLETLPSNKVKPLRVAGSPIHFECKLRDVLEIPGRIPEGNAHILVGSVVGIHIKDEVIDENGRIDIVGIKPLARVGYLDYTSVDHIFGLDDPELVAALHHNREVAHPDD
jgi:flavin reductase (DIM6/NTAB) family NADH-FMN oxidoreductase RutF